MSWSQLQFNFNGRGAPSLLIVKVAVDLDDNTNCDIIDEEEENGGGDTVNGCGGDGDDDRTLQPPLLLSTSSSPVYAGSISDFGSF